MITLITKRKSPSVTIVSGRVKIVISGLTTKFSTASTSAKIMAVTISLICTCGDKSFESTNTITAVIRMFTINLIKVFLG
jgi:hypothetical protein